ncbi:MAG TPA: Flp pilus assembly protein CpaB [Terricaulis sp.]|nr:Flp pilus assembly protein CpaB [Terricaulis sp.]
MGHANLRARLAAAFGAGRICRRGDAARVRGEPITLGSVIQPEGRSFLAAQLDPGYRAVSIKVDDHTAAGGFIKPNDRVDVILTQRISVRDGAGANEQVRSDIVLADVRVLAIGADTQPQTSGEAPTRTQAQVAVLELTPADARTAMLAQEMGDVSLALRGVQVETVSRRESQGTGTLNQSGGAVRVHAFGNVSGGS